MRPRPFDEFNELLFLLVDEEVQELLVIQIDTGIKLFVPSLNGRYSESPKSLKSLFDRTEHVVDFAVERTSSLDTAQYKSLQVRDLLPDSLKTLLNIVRPKPIGTQRCKQRTNPLTEITCFFADPIIHVPNVP